MNSYKQSSQAFFRYSGREKYIKLVEAYTDDPSTIQNCFILDEQLSIIHKQNKKDIDLSSLFSTCSQFNDKIIRLIEPEERHYLYEKWYDKYHNLKDFLIGREHWGRTQNALKISDDVVSRDHTRLAYHTRYQNQVQLALAIKAAIRNNTRVSSRWRKLTDEVIDKIIEFARDKPYYSLEDCLSRNGTYMIDYSLAKISLKTEQAYQFEHQQYLIYVQHISAGTGRELDVILSEAELIWKHSNSKYSFNRQIIFPPGVNRKNIAQLSQKFSAISLEFQVNHELRFFYWIIAKSEEGSYPIGEGQLLNVVYNQNYYEINRHGLLVFEKGKWFLQPSPAHHIWVKLQPQTQYLLSQPRYKIMIAHHSVLELSFLNFE